MTLDHSATDRRAVEAQLGRPARGKWRVAWRCHLGVPMVIENGPRLGDGTPFPTTFWLTCPLLVKRAGTLEAAGWMGELTAELTSNTRFKARLRSANDRYTEHRESLGESPAGIVPGGGPDRVKCLHAHLAHELAAGPNPVGARTLARTGWPDCVSACVEGPGQG